MASSTIVAFPLARDRVRVEGISDALASRSYEAGRKLWWGHLREERKRLKSLGLSPAAIRSEVASYSVTVGKRTLRKLGAASPTSGDAA